MARVIVLLLIALLPLRGWTVERMGIQIATAAQVSAMPADCAMHMQDGGKSASAEKGVNHQGCSTCQLCMPLAVWDAPEQFCVVTLPSIVPELQHRALVSIDPTQAVKPPLS